MVEDTIDKNIIKKKWWASKDSNPNAYDLQSLLSTLLSDPICGEWSNRNPPELTSTSLANQLQHLLLTLHICGR